MIWSRGLKIRGICRGEKSVQSSVVHRLLGHCRDAVENNSCQFPVGLESVRNLNVATRSLWRASVHRSRRGQIPYSAVAGYVPSPPTAAPPLPPPGERPPPPPDGQQPTAPQGEQQNTAEAYAAYGYNTVTMSTLPNSRNGLRLSNNNSTVNVMPKLGIVVLLRRGMHNVNRRRRLVRDFV
ncbi:hypothetical protein E1B28_007864 [Marasmius oreades]|uniref:Uncharacterized protein n=1 Tax=Marasmius oreades TaxID=181124 RepID=A0A9P7S2U0_9AGAR|nr:uncharacterized protein E1B28_007864 [Marasmius oreades]KAG7094260.1 hypothetical protein E1B28_007864 [Marasmius oreades]